MRSVAVRGMTLGFSLPLLLLGSAFAQGAFAQGQSPEQPGYPGQPSPSGPPPLEAGGLRPPGELQEEEEAPSVVEQDLARGDEQDSGRGLQFVWLNGDIGYQYVDLTALSDKNLVPGLDTTNGGLMFGGAAGVRLLYFTFGARFRYGTFEHWNLWSLLGEAGFRIPFGNFEPYVNVGAGYVSLASFDSERVRVATGTDSLQVRGVDVRLAGGFDYHFSDSFSLGPQISADLLILSRPAIAGATTPIYTESGSSLGLSLQGTLVVGLHF